MKLRLAAVLASVLVVGAGATALALSRTTSSSPMGCSDDCNLAAHQAQTSMHAMVGDDGMSGMSMPMHGGHMQMTPPREATAADRARAQAIVAALRAAIEPYTDYRVAEAAGYVPFHQEIQQPMYHFTSIRNAALNQFSFDPARPTSLIYKPVTNGYELVGAMYTAPRASTLDELNARVPLSVAAWHLHVNLCLPPAGEAREMLAQHPQFGLNGSIATADQCAAAGGTFKPVVYNWMVHVWPFESDPTKVWATQEHPGIMSD
jgi:hypothetical protein